MKSQSPARSALSHDHFFALRTPLLPWDEFLAWSDGLESSSASDDSAARRAALAADRERLRARIREQLDRPEVNEAVFVASPSLHESLDLWRQDPTSARGQKVERALVRYFARLTARPTPFGLFAGCSVGTIAPGTHLAIAGRDEYRRHTRLDAEYVLNLAEALVRDPVLRPQIVFRPNTTLYRAAGQWRYAETRVVDGQRSHHLAAADESEYLNATLARAAAGARPAELAAPLVDEDITRDDALGFIDELIDSQILVSDLLPAVTGPEPVHVLIERLESLPEAAGVVALLQQVRDAIDAGDRAGRVETDQYRRIADALEHLPAKVELPRLFQVDMYKPAPKATLSPRVADEITRGVELLARLAERDADDPLAAFRRAFVERYEGREVPLVEVLDEEIGIGFERTNSPAAEAGPLLAGIALPGAAAAAAPWQPRHAALLEMLVAAREAGRSQIQLTPADIDRLAVADSLPLPAAVSAIATLAADSDEAIDRGDYRILLHGALGPSGARMLGRFCHGDELLHRHVERHLRAEEAQRPEAIFAEVVHLPEGRVGNVLLRPVLRDYEISYLGASGAPADKQIPVTDLRVSVQDGRIVLRSAALNREIIPRLTNAHNYAWNSLGVYKFLCALQLQNVAGTLTWSWGPLESADFLPRVVHGRLVLARARWLVKGDELKALTAAKGDELFALVQSLRERRKLPRFVALRDNDNELPIDLDNVLSIEAAVDVLKNRTSATLVEMFTAAEGLPATGPEGRFTHELVVPLVERRPAPAAPQAVAIEQRASAAGASRAIRRRFAAGSEWLYVKIYAGPAIVDRLLRNEVRHIVDRVAETGACDRWFFIRYGDPDWHLRLRFHGEPARLLNEVLPLIEQALASPLEEGWVARVQYDAYEREIERYGGPAGIELAEELFHADSEAALSITGSCGGDEGLDARWRLALRGADQLLDDLGLSLKQKHALMRALRDEFAQEFGVGADFKQQAGQKFRHERASLEELMNREGDAESLYGPALAALAQRSERLAPIASRLRGLAEAGELTAPLLSIAASYVHMWVNRVLRSAHRAQEVVLYDFLDRMYQSALSRAAATPSAA